MEKVLWAVSREKLRIVTNTSNVCDFPYFTVSNRNIPVNMWYTRMNANKLPYCGFVITVLDHS